MKKTITFILALVMIFSLCACGSKPAAAPEAKTLIFGTSADYAPWEFMYPDENGEMIYGGTDVQVAQYIADYMGLELKTENMDFGYLLTALNKGDFDMVLADIEPTDERKAAVDFSDPYITEYPEKILIRAEDADKFKDVATDFEGCAVGAQTGSTKVDKVKDNFTGAECVSLALVTDLVNELVNGKVDAVLLDHSVAMKYAEVEDGLVIADASSFFGDIPLEVAVAVAKGDPKGLLPKINEAIAKMIEEGKIEEFVEIANGIVDTGDYDEVTADAPEGYEPD